MIDDHILKMSGCIDLSTSYPPASEIANTLPPPEATVPLVEDEILPPPFTNSPDISEDESKPIIKSEPDNNAFASVPILRPKWASVLPTSLEVDGDMDIDTVTDECTPTGVQRLE
jgi:hypothetical protein